jgi:hypothetical protein
MNRFHDSEFAWHEFEEPTRCILNPNSRVIASRKEYLIVWRRRESSSEPWSEVAIQSFPYRVSKIEWTDASHLRLVCPKQVSTKMTALVDWNEPGKVDWLCCVREPSAHMVWRNLNQSIHPYRRWGARCYRIERDETTFVIQNRPTPILWDNNDDVGHARTKYLYDDCSSSLRDTTDGKSVRANRTAREPLCCDEKLSDVDNVICGIRWVKRDGYHDSSYKVTVGVWYRSTPVIQDKNLLELSTEALAFTLTANLPKELLPGLADALYRRASDSAIQ